MRPLRPGNWCFRCGKSDAEPAGENCLNPGWHEPDPKVMREQEQARMARDRVEAEKA